MIEHKTILLEQLHEQDNKAVINSADSCPIILHFKNTLKSTVLIDCLKVGKLVKTTYIHHSHSACEKVCSDTLTPIRIQFVAYACPLVGETENSKKSENFNLTTPKTIL